MHFPNGDVYRFVLFPLLVVLTDFAVTVLYMQMMMIFQVILCNQRRKLDYKALDSSVQSRCRFCVIKAESY